jgi:hypothetical protein
MLELPMTSASAYKLPAIPFEQSNQLANLHRSEYSQSFFNTPRRRNRRLEYPNASFSGSSRDG